MQGATDADRPFAPGAGVHQGCPLSAVLFVLTAHPLLALIRNTIPELEAHMAYADDLAAVLACNEALARRPPVFDAWHKASGMKLDDHPFGQDRPRGGGPPWSHDAVRRDANPPWNVARVRQEACYLGIKTGPTAADHMWSAPIEKWKRRARQLVASGVAQDSTLREYRGRALPCLSYLAQFVGSPSNIMRTEQQLFATMTRFPFCACPRAMLHHGHRLRLVRAPPPPPVEKYCRAAILRAATRHS